MGGDDGNPGDPGDYAEGEAGGKGKLRDTSQGNLLPPSPIEVNQVNKGGGGSGM